MKKNLLPSSRERTGVLFLSLLILLVAGIRLQMRRNSPPIVWSMDTLVVPRAAAAEVVKTEQKKELSPERILVNEVDTDGLVKQGLNRYVAERWVKYGKSIGGFGGIEDLNRIYGLPEDWVVERGALLDFGERSKPARKAKRPVASVPVRQIKTPKEASGAIKRSEKKIVAEPVVDINQSNLYQWQRLSGIGPYYAKRIVNFRDKLGGFSHLVQVGETYGLPDSVFQKVKPQLRVSPIINKMKINWLTKDELKEHPYIKWKDAGILINYRDQHGDYGELEDLFRIRAFDSAYVHRLLPYLDFTSSGEITQIAEPNE